MTYIDTGGGIVRGATRQSWRSPTARALFDGLMDKCDDPRGDTAREKVFAEFIEIMDGKGGAQYHHAIFEYWLTNTYRAWLKAHPESQPRAAREQRAATVAALKTRAKETLTAAIDRKVEQRLLDWILPNGKALRDCSGRECREMSRELGSGLARIAEKVKPDEIVGQVLREEQVRKLWRRA
jgi:hypothetical protein